MVSTTISQALLTIVAISLAVALAVAVMSQLSNILNSMSIAVNHRSEALRMVITVTNAYYDPVSHTFHIFVKNTGDVPYSDLNNIDVYLGNASGVLDYYNISTANITEYGPEPGVWVPGETIEITINTTTAYSPPYEVKIVLSNGVSTTYVFG